ncbi:hypothetical protein ACOSP7_024949 [Xanthoceras sorbifolium]
MKKHYEFFKKNASFFRLFLLSLSLSNSHHFNQFLVLWHPLMIMMKIFLHLNALQTRITILQLVLLSNHLKSFQMEDRNLTHKSRKFSIGKQKIPGHRIES